MSKKRAKIVVRGAVQGVGFRPFVYRLATELGLFGWVLNSSQGVIIEVEGDTDSVTGFLHRLEKDRPARAVIQRIESSYHDLAHYRTFEIHESSEVGGKTAFILPDVATCSDCLREILDPKDRRYRYPFTNCTNCGPRFSIIDALPYDRAHTSMKIFTMCAECAREYCDPADRRFHAEPTACERCGPQLQLWDSLGTILAKKDAALLRAAAEIRAGRIVALKGLGGFQLLVDARNEEAVANLRRRKQREEKPFAVMFPSLEMVGMHCDLEEGHSAGLSERDASRSGSYADRLEARRPTQAGSLTSGALLLSPESPIVLLKARAVLAQSVAPDNPNLGVMLPYTPLHHLLMRELDFPIVATSGNLSDEPICIDENEALERLRGLADFFLVHDRPIVRHIDDSIVRLMAGRRMILRRARGFAPLPIRLTKKLPAVLSTGAHLKNTVALGVGRNVFLSQHIGDLATPQAHDAFVRAARDLPQLYDVQPEIIGHDLHPDYLSTKFGLEQPGRHVGVQHHWAHVAACMAENEVEPPLLGVAWDGTGYGLDGTIWGGEFFLVLSGSAFERLAHLRTFRLPGGDRAIKEPRRSALGLLHEIFGESLWERDDLLKNFSPNELALLRQMLEKRINAPVTSSAGRLFDAVAALIGVRERVSFEGQAAMALEFVADPAVTESYPFTLRGNNPTVIDWETSVRALLGDLEGRTPPATMAAKFHNLLAEMIVAVACSVGQRKVVLSGGCFQNRLLTERTVIRLHEENFQPFWHQEIPPNDGGISLGQIVAASWQQHLA